MAKILEILIIQRISDLNWFNNLVINSSKYVNSIIKVLFLDNLCRYLIEIEIKMKYFLEGLK